MIRYTLCDPDFEEYSLSEDGMMALPLTVHEDAEGNVSIESYSTVSSAVKEVAEKPGDNLFTEESHRAFMKALEPEMKHHGYCSVPETGDVLLEFLHDASSLSEADEAVAEYIILHTNDEISAFDAYTTGWCLEVDDEDPADVICAVIVDGKVAAFACVNDVSEYGYEVTVECAHAFRGRGFGSTCAYGLAKHVLDTYPDETVSYVCREKNTASVKTAHRAGYVPTGKRRDYVFYRD